MLKALYFPSTDISNPEIIKNSLLLWDKVQTIVPHRSWQPLRRAKDKAFNEAVDLVVEPHVPTRAERQHAHSAVSTLFRTPLVASLLREAPPGYAGRQYLVYPQKFLDQTWDMLMQSGHARLDALSSDYGVPPGLGLLMMSVLSDACAGSQIQRFTDRVEAYGWLAEHHARVLGEPHVTGLDVSHVAPTCERLVTLAVRAIDARRIPLRNLVEMRKREHRRGGTDYSAMRRRLSSAIQAHVTKIGTEARTAGDIRELERQFAEGLKQDLADLKAELRLTTKKALFSKEVFTSILVGAGCLTSPIAGLTTLGSTLSGIGVIPLAKAAVEYRGARRDALRRHTMSWLYLASRGRPGRRWS